MHGAGVRDTASPWEKLLLDAEFAHGGFFQLIGFDPLHHWFLGSLKRFGCDQIQVLTSAITYSSNARRMSRMCTREGVAMHNKVSVTTLYK
jgi:hypothetical protein